MREGNSSDQQPSLMFALVPKTLPAGERTHWLAVEFATTSSHAVPVALSLGAEPCQELNEELPAMSLGGLGSSLAPCPSLLLGDLTIPLSHRSPLLSPSGPIPQRILRLELSFQLPSCHKILLLSKLTSAASHSLLSSRVGNASGVGPRGVGPRAPPHSPQTRELRLEGEMI